MKQSKESDDIPADAWPTPKYVEPDHGAAVKSTRDQRTEMAKQMMDNVPCAFCSSLFPIEALEYCSACIKLYCYECIGDGRLCKDCRPLFG